MPAIMFSTNVMDERTENNKQTNCFLKIFIRNHIRDLPKKEFMKVFYGLFSDILKKENDYVEKPLIIKKVGITVK